MSTGFKDHFSGHAADYARARPRYPQMLYNWLADQCDKRALAWDCATGNGQAAVALAEYFDAVFATDASAEQIANAAKHPRVQYEVSPAEDSGLPTQSVDLVTVAQAMHWFDLKRFYAEVKRVLKPRGVFAAWGYDLTRVEPAIDAVIDRFDRELVGPYWPPERAHIDAHYADFEFPFLRIEAPPFVMRNKWNREQFLDYIGTWSSVRRYLDEKKEDPREILRNELAPLWPEKAVREVHWPMFFLAGINQE